MRYGPKGALALGTMMAASPPVAAQGADPAEVRIPRTEVHRLNADGFDQEFEIWIAHPVPGFAPVPPGPRQVLYVLDANLFFGTAVEMTRIMAQLYGELPPLVVVGVAIPDGRRGPDGRAARPRLHPGRRSGVRGDGFRHSGGSGTVPARRGEVGWGRSVPGIPRLAGATLHRGPPGRGSGRQRPVRVVAGRGFSRCTPSSRGPTRSMPTSP